MLKRTIKTAAGVALIIVGVAGIFLPVVPGILLIFIGSAFIMDKSPKLLFKEIAAKVKEEYEKRRKKTDSEGSDEKK